MRIFGLKTNSQGEYEIRINQEIEELYRETNIVKGIFKEKLKYCRTEQ